MKKLLILVLLIFVVPHLFGEQMISLEDARELLLQNNPEYLAKHSSLKAAEWDRRQALSSLLPAVRLQGGYNYLDPEPYLGAQENYSFSYGLNLTQPLFTGGRLWLSYRMANDRVRIARADLDNTRLHLLSELEESYYNYLLAEDLYQINLQALKVARKHLEIAETRMEAGALSRADYLQFQSELSAKEVSLVQAENSKQLSYRRLQNLIKKDGFSVLPVELSLYDELAEYYQELQPSERERNREKLIDYGKAHNPLLIMSRIGKDISRKALTMSKGNFLPTINLTASHTWNDNFTGSADFENSTSFIISASLPIFPVIDNYSAYRESYHSYRRTEREVETAEDNIKLAVEAAFYSGITSARSITSAELSRQYAEETYRMMEERFRNGLISSVDLISIELLLTTSSLEAVNSKYEFLKNRSALLNLLNIEDDQELLDIMNDEF